MQQTFNRLRGISLREVLPQCRIVGDDDIRVSSCSGDSRTCKPGDLFAALVGSQSDGHDWAAQAVERGATALLTERLLPANVPMCIVRNTREAYGHICQALFGHPSRQLNTIGVSGTNGKTTTCMLIAAVLKAAGARPGVMGTLGYCDSSKIAPAPLTTPGAPQLAHWLARMQANGCTHAVVEVSSHALAQSRTAGIELDAAVMTNVRRDHLDYHGSILNYRNTKAKLFEQLRPQGFAVLNADDPGGQLLLSKLDNPLLTVSTRYDAEISATVVERHKSEQTFLLSAGSETTPVRTRMIGDHHISNCMLAAAVGLVYGIDLPTVVRGLESVDYVPGRLERIECGQPYSVYVDYAHTPDALAVSLKTLRQVTEGRLICVYGAGGDRDGQKRPQMGRIVERSADLGIITNDNPRGEPPLAIIHDILDGYDRPARAHILPDRAEAIYWALDQACPGDSVLVAGKGHENHQIIGTQRLPFDDREVVRDWLYQAASESDNLLAMPGRR